MRRSKYPNIGILDLMFRLVGAPASPYSRHKDFSREEIFRLARREDVDIDSKKLAVNFYRLKRSGYIKECGLSKFRLTDIGIQKAKMKMVKEVKFRKKKRDRFHRLIIFDIPESKRMARDVIRNKLRDFECKKVQKSVYITSYICEKEIRQVAKLLDISPYVSVFKVKI